MAQVGGQVGVDARRAHLGEQAVARAAAHRDPADQPVRVTGDPDTGGGGRQAGGDPRGERGQRQRGLQQADPPGAAPAQRVGRVRDQRAGHGHADRLGERVRDTRVGVVGVGVGHVQGDPGADQGVHDPALEGGGGHGGGAAQVQRVVGDHQVRPPLDGLVDDRLHGVDGEQHAADLGLRVSADQADGVPGLRPLRRVQLFEGGDDVGQFRHLSRLPCARGEPSARPAARPTACPTACPTARPTARAPERAPERAPGRASAGPARTGPGAGGRPRRGRAGARQPAARAPPGGRRPRSTGARARFGPGDRGILAHTPRLARIRNGTRITLTSEVTGFGLSIPRYRK